MKAKKRNSNNDWQEVEYVQLKDSYVITKADQMEFENENSVSTSTDWEQVRINAAIAAMQGILCSPIIPGVNPNPSKREIADLAVLLADVLIEELRKQEKPKE